MAGTVATQRFGFIDWFRGLACILMIQTHAHDSWTKEPHRQGTWWIWARLKLRRAAGANVSVSGRCVAGDAFCQRCAQSSARGRCTARCLSRGLEVFLIGYGFRIAEWLLGGGKVKDALSMLKVDVLQCIGLSLMITAFGGVAARSG